MLFNLNFEFLLNSYKKWQKRGKNWRDCHEDAAKSSRIGNQFRSGSCFSRQNTLEVDVKYNKCNMLFNLTFVFSLTSFKKWHKRGQNWRDCHQDAAKSSHIGNQFGYDLLFYSTKHVGSRPKIKLMQSVIQFKF